MNHHAYLCIGKREWALGQFPVRYDPSNVDHRLLSFERMYIDDARRCIEDALYAPYVTDSTRIVFICVEESILLEAQNALLKMFEEPHEDLVFCVQVPNTHSCIPTLRSRFELVATETEKYDQDVFETLHALSYAKRIAMIQKRVDAEDTEWMYALTDGFIAHMRANKNAEGLKDALFVREYLNLPGSSPKMLLNTLMLSF